MNIQAGIYIHFPFCTTKCNYCGFYSIPNHPERVSEYLTMLEREMEIQAPLSQQFTMDTIFLGGGTPSLMTIEQLERIFSQLHDNFTVSEHPEITLETNPTSISAHKAEQIFSTRINRLSLGCQSFDDTLLKTLGRNHKAYDNIKIYSLFRNAGFKNISIDLIFSIPGQTMNQWIDSLSQTIALRPEHISLYCLSYEEGTQFTRLIRTGKITAVDEDTELQMFRTCIDMLTDAGYVQYEISNFALPGYQSRHNTLYWKNLPCIGLGTSAYSYVNGERYQTIPDVQQYCSMLNTQKKEIHINHEKLPDEMSLRETAALAVRLIHEGIDIEELQKRYSTINVKKIIFPTIQKLIDENLLKEKESNVYVLTAEGIRFADYIAEELM